MGKVGYNEWKRHLIQLYAGLLYNAHIRGFIEGRIYVGNTKAACVPGMNCYSCPGAIGACPLGSLQNALASSGNRAGFYIFGILMLYGLFLGRTICGWLCPFGLLQELLHKIPTPKIRKNRVTRALTWLKYVLLIGFAGIIPLYYGLSKGIPVPGFCKYICPAGTLEGATALLANVRNSSMFSMLGIFFTRKAVIMIAIALLCIFCYRSFCRFICPLGAIYGFFSKIALIGVKVDAGRCNGCGACVRTCQMDVRHVGDHECIHCAKCVHVCPKNAIALKAGRVTLIAREEELAKAEPAAKKRRTRGIRITQLAAAALLVCALIGCNLPEKQEKTAEQSAASEVTVSTAEQNGTSEEAASAAEAGSLSAGEEAAAEQSGSDAEEKAAEEQKDTSAEESDTAGGDDLPVGHEVGNRLEDFTIECVDGSEFRLADMKDKVVMINLWATYCGPCVKELPYFSDLYQAHQDELAILAVHSSLVTEDVADFLNDKGWAMPFAVDTTDDLIWNITGGTTTLPQTIVLNTKGEVIYNQVGSVTPELLDKLYSDAGGS